MCRLINGPVGGSRTVARSVEVARGGKVEMAVEQDTETAAGLWVRGTFLTSAALLRVRVQYTTRETPTVRRASLL